MDDGNKEDLGIHLDRRNSIAIMHTYKKIRAARMKGLGHVERNTNENNSNESMEVSAHRKWEAKTEVVNADEDFWRKITIYFVIFIFIYAAVFFISPIVCRNTTHLTGVSQRWQLIGQCVYHVTSTAAQSESSAMRRAPLGKALWGGGDRFD